MYPFGDTSTVTVLTASADGLSEGIVKKLLEGNKEFTLTKFGKKA